ncbi:extracellular calcium-sensing receptor-like [Ascaphus truei]|uniref:extracellular calcium-sensing receptor-like n=1 Tax=Ascaphus truei TaxID=8439 RepID=UPI003F5A2C4C
MVYAINEINENPELLPNITLGFRIYDSCYKETQAVEGAMRILSEIQRAIPNYRCENISKLVGLIGDLQSSSSLAVARILGLYRFPQISYGSAFADLSDKIQFPSFLRTIINDKTQSWYFPNLMIHFGWTWVGILASDNDFGLYSSELMRKDIEAAGICVAFFMKISAQHSRDQTLSILQVIRKSTATVILMYCSLPELIPFMQVATAEHFTGKIWFASASWIASPIFSYKEFWGTLNGTIGITILLTKIPGFRKFLYSIHPSSYPGDIFIKAFWEEGFGCLWPKDDHNQTASENLSQGSTRYCTGQENLHTLESLGYHEDKSRHAMLMYNAVYALAHGVNDMISCKSASTCFNISRLQPWKGPIVVASTTNSSRILSTYGNILLPSYSESLDELAKSYREGGITYEVGASGETLHARAEKGFSNFYICSTSAEYPSLCFHDCHLLHYIKRVRFNNTAGQEVFFNEFGEQSLRGEYVNWQALPNGTSRYVNVGVAIEGSEWGVTRSNNTIFWSGGYTELTIRRHDCISKVCSDEQILVPTSICSERCPPGYRKAPQNGQPVCCFDCVLCSAEEFSNETDSISCMKCPDGMWPNERHDGCRFKSLEFLSYEDPLGGTLASLSIVGALLPLSILVIFLKNSETPIVKANNRGLSYLLLMALILCYLCSLLFIGHPLNITCILQQITFGISFVLCISCVLGKTIMVVIAFNSTQPKSNRPVWLNSRVPNTLVLVCTAIQVIICISWIAHSTLFQNNDGTSKLGTIIVECNEGALVAFWCMLGYMGLLATLSFALAYLARKLPGSFNEAKLITFSMLIFGVVWVSFIPAYLSTRGKYMVAVEIFAILTSSSGLLVCIFFPKCYIIILKPEMNNKECFTGKRMAQKNKLK